ncbi:helix-turn-helix domain-containing protein [Bacillus sp. AFS041924]|uniref:helix-turn-helix domain-containing protein n=1 Tax=Bacillus sp. AFS041924 TaxID=2033503 RepID=UPI000BFDAF1F|nr:helix-turn-helix transcriptional regulator [Bacillus sp. AFS041924]PGS51758.1 transcriptional regulator [Bacillus sp. AFS041924]
MYEGKIIRYYREKYQMTQEQLGKGICSGTHISKIERLQTEYAPEIITLLSERLGINIEQEDMKLKNIKKRLDHWHEVIIMQLFEEMDLINFELEQEELIQISNYINQYKLLRIRYLLMRNLIDESNEFIDEIKKIKHKLSPYEINLFRHVMGIYHLSNHEPLLAIKVLKEINNEEYTNGEYYYHLAVAYHSSELPVLAYFYADKARQFFKSINSYLRVIDSEMIMLIQIKDNEEFSETIKRFEKLIQSCEICKSSDRKARVFHNLAFEYYRKNNYCLAKKYYFESMKLKDHESIPYLLSLEGYIRSSYYGELLPKDELLQLIKEGFEIAFQKNDKFYISIFTLLDYLISEKEQEYHQYLADYSLPFFKKLGFVYLINRSEKELFNYYFNRKQTRKALSLANTLINK